MAAKTDAYMLCSLGRFAVVRWAQATYLLGRALPDTALAGMGDIQPTAQNGYRGSGAPRTTYGQIVDVDRFDGPTAQGSPQRSGAVAHTWC